MCFHRFLAWQVGIDVQSDTGTRLPRFKSQLCPHSSLTLQSCSGPWFPIC